MNLFEALPPESRLWIFPLAEQLSSEEKHLLSERMENFVASWKAHGDRVDGEFTILRERFLVVAATEEQVLVSGCSIDSLFRFVSDALAALGVKAADFSDVFFLEQDQVKKVSRPEFKNLAQRGEVSADTVVFDTALQRLKEFRESGFERPAGSSWHSRLLAPAERAAV